MTNPGIHVSEPLQPTSRCPFLVTYGSPSGAGGQGNDIIDSFVLGSSRAKQSKRTTCFNYKPPLTTQTTTRRQRRERNGPRLFGLGTEAFGFAAASSLGFRATHIPLSAPRFAISSSPPHQHCVLQSRIVFLSLFRLSIRFATHLRHLPFSTFQVIRLLPSFSCSDYLTRSVKSRYTTCGRNHFTFIPTLEVTSPQWCRTGVLHTRCARSA